MALERVKEVLKIGLSKDYDKDVSAKEYERRISNRRRLLAQSISNRISEFCPSIAADGTPSKVLELAAGTGIITRKLDERFEVISLDYSRNMLRNLQQNLLDVPLVQADMNRKLPFMNNSFEGATLVWANRYIEGNNLPNFVDEIRRVLKPDGVFVWPVFPVEGFLWNFRMFPAQLKQFLSEFSDVKTVTPPFRIDGQPPLHAPGYVIAKK